MIHACPHCQKLYSKKHAIKRLTLDIPATTHTNLKLAATKQGISITELVLQALSKYKGK